MAVTNGNAVRDLIALPISHVSARVTSPRGSARLELGSVASAAMRAPLISAAGRACRGSVGAWNLCARGHVRAKTLDTLPLDTARSLACVWLGISLSRQTRIVRTPALQNRCMPLY